MEFFKKVPEREKNRAERGKLTPQQRKLFREVFRAALLLIFIIWGLLNLSVVKSWVDGIISLLSPFLIGCGVAFLINMVLNRVEDHWKGVFKKNADNKIIKKLMRPVCLTCSTLFVFAAIGALLCIIIPEIRSSFDNITMNMTSYVKKVTEWWGYVVELAAKYKITLPQYAGDIDTNSILEKVTSFISEKGSGILSVTWDATTSIAGGVVNVVIGIVFAMYILGKKETIGFHLKRFLYLVLADDKADQVVHVVAIANQNFTGFVGGQIIEAIIIGGLCALGMWILKLPYAAVVGVIVGVTALIPVFGAWIGGGFGAFLILTVSPIKAIWFIVFLIVLQQVETNLIYPKVVGKTLGLPGILVMMAVIIGGGGFGFFGMLLGVPICGVLYTLYIEFVERRSREKKLTEKFVRERDRIKSNKPEEPEETAEEKKSEPKMKETEGAKAEEPKAEEEKKPEPEMKEKNEPNKSTGNSPKKRNRNYRGNGRNRENRGNKYVSEKSDNE